MLIGDSQKPQSLICHMVEPTQKKCFIKMESLTNSPYYKKEGDLLSARVVAFGESGYSNPSDPDSVKLEWSRREEPVAAVVIEHNIWPWIWLGIIIGLLIIGILATICLCCYRPRVIACFDRCKRSD